MTRDHILDGLKDRLGGDFTPVKPLGAPWRRALIVLPLWLAIAGLVLAIFGFRTDYEKLGAGTTWSFGLIQLLVCFFLFSGALKSSIPARGSAPIVWAGLLVIGLSTHLATSWLSFNISPGWAEPGRELKSGLACLSAILIASSLPFLMGVFLLRAGLPLQPRVAGTLLGLASGLAAEGAWRLHCPITSWDHILPFHGGALLAGLVCGLLFGAYSARNRLGAAR